MLVRISLSRTMLLPLLLPSLVVAQWGIGQQTQQLFGGQLPQLQSAQAPSQFGGYPQQNFGMGLFNQKQLMGDNSRFGSPLIHPSMMGYGYPGQMPQMQMNNQGGYPFPAMMSGVPTAMGMGRYPNQMNSMSMPRPFGQFQADSVNNDVQKTVFASEPTRIIPPFMRTATSQQLDAFYAIVQNPVWSPSEKQEKIEEFVRSMDTNTQNTFASYSRATQSEADSKRQKVHKLVDQMTPQAQVQFQKVSALMTNPQLNETERLQKIQDVYSKIPDNIKKEFDEKLTNL